MPASFLSAVVEAARAAGQAILEVRGGPPLQIRQKAEGPVTQADLAANTLLEARLRALDTSAAWLSEETADSPERLTRRRLWIVDPLDGTQEFIQGSPHFAVSIALVEDGRPLLGVLHFPVGDATLQAVAGEGARLCVAEGAPQRLWVRERDAPFVLAVRRSDMRRPWMQALAQGLGGASLKPLGSTTAKLAEVARGGADAYVTQGFTPYVWDVCAGDVVLSEAGGVLTDPAGAPVVYDKEDVRVGDGLIACRADRLDAIVKVLRGGESGAR